MMQHESHAELRDTLRSHGLRYSRPRAAILAFFRERATHVSAEGLYQSLRERGEPLSLSTVYLNLGILRDVGLVREFRGVGGEALFDSNVEPHYHLLCKGCGAILDLPALEIEGVAPERFLRERAEGLSGWRVDEPSLNLQGVCERCSGPSEH